MFKIGITTVNVGTIFIIARDTDGHGTAGTAITLSDAVSTTNYRGRYFFYT